MVKIRLFDLEKEKAQVVVQKTKKTRARKKKEPTARDLSWEISKSFTRIEELEAQDETNFSDFDKSVKGKAVNIPLVKNHISYYRKQLAEIRSPTLPLLNKWKDFIIKYCKEHNQEIELIWFDESCPYDVAISVRLKDHRCWSSCVQFRFQDNQLKAFDSHFGGGTSTVWINPYKEETAEEKVEQILQRVFKKECSDSSWEDREKDYSPSKREIEINEQGYSKVLK